ncbi:GIY-YIG nuclease family protein [Patescibacteria group bacterium]
MTDKVLTIFIKDSDLNGIKIAEVANSNSKVYVIPRDKLDFIKSRDDLSFPALYLLIDDERTTLYVGECENFKNRIYQHKMNKKFWFWVVVFVSSGGVLDKADVKFLESHTIAKAIEVNRFNVQNLTSPVKINLHEFKMATVMDLFNDFELLITVLGFNIFEPLKEDVPSIASKKGEMEKKETDTREYDTIIGPSIGSGRKNAFEKENAWWAVRIGKNNIKKLKYVGLYEAAPVSAIRVYAKITKIEPYHDSPGKYIIHHDGNIHKLENPIILGNHPELALFGPRYYKLGDIISSKTMAELTDKAFGTNYQESK